MRNLTDEHADVLALSIVRDYLDRGLHDEEIKEELDDLLFNIDPEAESTPGDLEEVKRAVNQKLHDLFDQLQDG